MSRYSIICRLRWPAALLLTGVIALLDQMDVLSWGRAWPLYLILFGVLALAERAAMASQPPSAVYVPNAGYAPGYTPQPGVYPGPYSATAPSGNPIPPAPPYQPVSSAQTGIVAANPSVEVSTIDPVSQPRKSWEEEEGR